VTKGQGYNMFIHDLLSTTDHALSLGSREIMSRCSSPKPAIINAVKHHF